MKYQCNACGVIYDRRGDAVMCHPDISEIEDEVDLARCRHSELVDKKFAGKITDEEIAELAQVNEQLNEADRAFYEPTLEKLRAVYEAAAKIKGDYSQ